jgi:putative membrane protein
MSVSEPTKTSPKDTTTFKEAPFLALKGFLMGSADIVPGVSGGTMALIVGIYERLLDAIKSVNSSFLKSFFSFKWKVAFEEVHFKFLIILFAGIFSALAFFTKVVPLQVYMFTHPEIVYGLFFGLIVGSIYILIKALERFSKIEMMMVILGVAFGVWVVSLVPADTPEHPAFVFLSGSIAICPMILPGISGSYLLLIMRKYDYLLSQIGMLGGNETLDGLLGLFPFILGAIVGLAAFSRFLSWLLSKFHSQTISVLIGFLIGSLVVIWPFQHRQFVEQVRDVEVLEPSNPKVQELMEGEPNTNLPEYERIEDIVYAKTGDGAIVEVQVETVKNKLIKSEPYIPGWLGEKRNDDPNIWGGIAGILIGIVMVGGLERLREK